MKNYKIAVIPGDGIGKEVMPEALKVLQVIKDKFQINLILDRFDWSCENFLKVGYLLDWKI